MPRRNTWNSVPCTVDGREYKSIFAAAIDNEIDYSWLFMKLKKSGGKPVTICGHRIELCEKNATPGAQSGKEKDK